MANTIKIKRSSQSGKVPLTTDLSLGELGINTADGHLFLKRDNGTESIVNVGRGPINDLSDVAITSAANGQLLKFDGSNWVNSNTVQAATSGAQALIVKGVAGQSVDIFNVGTSTTQATFRMLSTGALQQNANFTCIGTGLFQGFSAGSTKPLVARAVASQTVSLFEAQNSSSTPLFSVSKDGYISAGSTYNGQLTLTGSFKIDGTGASETAMTVVSPNNGYGQTTLTLARVPADAKWNFTTGNVGLNFVTGAFSWTGVGIDLPAGTGPGAKLHINCDLATKKGMLIKAHASQSENLFEVQNSSAGVLASISSSGKLLVNRTSSPVLGSERIAVGGTTDANYISVDGGVTNNGDGAAFLARNNGSTIAALGNYSAAYSGSTYDATPTLYFSAAPKVLGLGAGAGSSTMKWDSTTFAWTYDTSSERYKNNIRDCTYGLDAVMYMIPRQFNYKDSGRPDVGFIAEEMIDIVPEVVITDAQGQPESLNYDRLVAVLCKAIQELKLEVEHLRGEIRGKNEQY